MRRIRIGGGGYHKNAKGPASTVHGGVSTSDAGACVARFVPLDTKKYSSSTQKLRFLVGVPICETSNSLGTYGAIYSKEKVYCFFGKIKDIIKFSTLVI